MKSFVFRCLLSLGVAAVVAGCQAPQMPLAEPAAMSQGVYFTNLKDGAVVTSPFLVQFGLQGKQIGPLGDMNPEMGHHHLIINGPATPSGEVVPANATHLHFGKGQTQTELNLPPGDYTLTLQFGNGAHQSYGAAWSQTIHVHVKAP
jgi:Domain of unknown function (DUF4399)